MATLPCLLLLSSWFPGPPDNGSRLRAFYLLRELSKAYRIRLIVGVQEDSPAEIPASLAALCEAITPIPWRWPDNSAFERLRSLVSAIPRAVRESANPPFAAVIRAELEDHPPNIVLALQMGMDAYLPDDIFRRFPVILDEAEVSGWLSPSSFGGRERLRRRMTYEKSARYWPKRLRRYNAITAVSQEEAEAVRSLLGSDAPPVHVVPNGIDVASYLPRRQDEVVPGRLIYNGALTYGPNRDALCWLARDILPGVAAQVPEVHVIVTGRFRTEDRVGLEGNERIHLTGYLPHLREALAESAVCIVPLLSGGGTRLKMLEAWAAGVPVVSTTVGAMGLQAVNGRHLLLRDDPELFAEAVAVLLRDPDLGEALAGEAHRFVAANYDWRVPGTKLIEILEQARASTL